MEIVSIFAELKSSQAFGSLPIFILTANQSIHEKALGFQLGIEDFVVKPFDPVEFQLRVESRLKKLTAQQQGQDVLIIGSLRIDFLSQRVNFQSAKEHSS